MSKVPATRSVEGVEVPAAGRWEIDPAHSSVEFVARHLMLAKVRGRFAGFSGTLNVADVPEESWVDVTIDAATIDTREPQRDQHLRSPDFLDAERYPTLRYEGGGLEQNGGSRFKLFGSLTIRAVTRPLILDVEFQGVTEDPWGGTRAVFSASAEIDREDFGLTWNQALETGGVLVGKRVRIEIEIEAVRS